MPAVNPTRPGEFRVLCDECEAKGWRVVVDLRETPDSPRRPLIIVLTGGEQSYSRWVQGKESFDQAARIMLDGLHKSKVL